LTSRKRHESGRQRRASPRRRNRHLDRSRAFDPSSSAPRSQLLRGRLINLEIFWQDDRLIPGRAAPDHPPIIVLRGAVTDTIIENILEHRAGVSFEGVTKPSPAQE
jgi:hypothetical protein